MSDVPPAWEELSSDRLELLGRMAALGPSTEPMRRVPSRERASEDEARARV